MSVRHDDQRWAPDAQPRGGADAVPAGARAVVVTCSNRSARGERPDESGAILAAGLAEWGLVVDGPVVVPDEVAVIRRAIADAADAGAALVVTSGGTGVTPTDVTPEATRPLLDREIPGIAEALRLASREKVPTSVLSRGLAGLVGSTLVVNLAGSPGAARDGLRLLGPLVGHVIAQAKGGDHA